MASSNTNPVAAAENRFEQVRYLIKTGSFIIPFSVGGELLAFVDQSEAVFLDHLAEVKRRAQIEDDIIQSLGEVLDFPREAANSDLIDGCGLIAEEIAKEAALKITSLKTENAELRMRFMQLTSTLTRLKAWNKEYPAGRHYSHSEWLRAENEFTGIIQDLLSIAGPAPEVESPTEVEG